MTSCTFEFDVVVTHFESSKIDIEDPKKLQVEITIANRTVKITASRINVSEFKPGSGTELTVDPVNLRQTLEECGMPVLVKYNDLVLGTGHISFPKTITESIAEDMPTVLHVDSCSFGRDGEDVGRLELLCRLLVKCVNQEKPEESSCRRDMDKSINRQDILFIMSESQRCPNRCDPCLDVLDPENDDGYIRFGMQSSNVAAPKFAETLIHNPAGDSCCCEIKKMADECEQVIDSIFKRSGQPIPLKPPCRRPAGQSDPCSGRLQKGYEESAPAMPCFSYLPERQVESKHFGDPHLSPLPIHNIKKAKRFCPVCLTNMLYLPKLAACPNCGVKPMPVIEEPRHQHEKKKLTTDQILSEYLCKSPNTGEEKESIKHQSSKCRCTCTSGKLCAYCRVRKECSEFYKNYDSQIYEKPEKNDDSDENYCQQYVERDESRLFLGRVFSELCDLNNIKDIKRPDDLERERDQKSNQKKKITLKPKQVYKDDKKQTIPVEKRPNLTNHRLKTAPEHVRLISKLHKHCVDRKGRVSHRHGWNWSVSQEARQYGWRPGAIRRPIVKLMKFFLQYSSGNNTINKCKKDEEAMKEKERQMPILNMCKKNGEIFITLRALDNPHVHMEPIVFKLVKSDLAVALREIKRKLKDKGFRKCTCHQTLMMCVCRNLLEKKHLEYAVQKESKRHGIENCAEHLVLTDTSESEMEFDFDVTPPAGVAKTPCPLKRQTFSNGTQTDNKDLIVPPKYPVSLDPYWRAYDCAAGDRYTGTAFGAPGEDVFEDGVFGHGGGGPHGPSAAPRGKAKPAGVWGASPGGPIRGGGRVGPGGIGGGSRGGVGGGRGGDPGGKLFPGAKKEKKGPSPLIPVRMPKRHIEGIKKAVQAEKDAIKNEIARRKKGVDTMKYLMEKGTVATPWDPNNPLPKGAPRTKAPEVGPDGLTHGQRTRCALRQMPIPPLDTMPRLGKGYDHSQCYDYCGAQSCYQTCYCG